MLGCLLSLFLFAILVLLGLWAAEALITAFELSPPPAVIKLIRVFATVIIVVAVLDCFFGGALVGGRFDLFGFGHRAVIPNRY